jgi:hypothetical protein
MPADHWMKTDWTILTNKEKTADWLSKNKVLLTYSKYKFLLRIQKHEFCNVIGSLSCFEFGLETNLNLSWSYFPIIGRVWYRSKLWQLAGDAKPCRFCLLLLKTN